VKKNGEDSVVPAASLLLPLPLISVIALVVIIIKRRSGGGDGFEAAASASAASLSKVLGGRSVGNPKICTCVSTS
jgi:hypothetical protein